MIGSGERAFQMRSEALAAGADNAAVICVRDIPFHREFRDACKQNACGFYNACWMCPPDIGDIDTLIQRARQFKFALVYQTISMIADSYDIEGMSEAARRHNKLAQELKSNEALFSPKQTLHLGAGRCQLCEVCAKRSHTPCRMPEKAISSLEAYGIFVSELAAVCGMKYINGMNTVTYFGAILYR